MARSENPLAYSLRPYNAPRDLTIAAWLPCSLCQDVEKVKISSMGNNPGLIEQAFKHMGWNVNVHRAKACVCPKCIAKQKKEEDLLKHQPTPPERILKTVQPVSVVPALNSRGGSAQTISHLRDLTKEQRGLLREEIEAYFNEEAGRWESGHSDHNASETLGIPRAIVIEFRESFYGPLKEDSDVTWLKAEIVGVRREIAATQGRLSKMEERLALIQKKVGL